MSGEAETDNLVFGHADEIEAAASDWLARRVTHNWGEADEAALQAWLNETPAHRIAFLRLEAAWGYTSRLGALRAPRRELARDVKARGRVVLRIAAAMVVLALVGLSAGAYFGEPREKIYTTTVGGRETLKLADGSQIELNTDTVLRLVYSRKVRKATLERGEAYFHITHDAARPFTVRVAQHRVTDLGTKFLVRHAASDTLEVAVTEGLVRLDAPQGPAGSRSDLLSVGDVAVVTAHNTVVTRKPAQKLAEELGWRHGVLVLDNATLADAAAQFNRYNSRKLVIAPSAARIAIGGTFPTNNIEAFTELAQDVLGLKIEERKDQILISR